MVGWKHTHIHVWISVAGSMQIIIIEHTLVRMCTLGCHMMVVYVIFVLGLYSAPYFIQI